MHFSLLALAVLLSESEVASGWKMPAHCGSNPDIVETRRNWIQGNYELNKTGSYPPELVKQLFHAPDTSWQDDVENGICDESTEAKYKIACGKNADGRQVFKFPPGSLFEITRQIALRPDTVIEGAGNPNPGGKNGHHRLRPNPQEMTFFWSNPSHGTHAFYHDGTPQFCGCSWESTMGSNGNDPTDCKMACSPEMYRVPPALAEGISDA
jgi:hypothetical protein